MAKIKTSELTGAALDWAVARCEGHALHCNAILNGYMRSGWWVAEHDDPNVWLPLSQFDYSASWAQGGPIIEREKIELRFGDSDGLDWIADKSWHTDCDEDVEAHGPTPLIAAMRCYCCSKLGDIVDVQEELCQQQSS